MYSSSATNKPTYNYSTITLNQTNLVTSNNNNVYRYNFPVNADLKAGDSIAVSSVSMYNSFYNIRAEYNNNSFSYRWWQSPGTTAVVVQVTLPDGFYSFSDINSFLQQTMITNRHYLINNLGQFVYYISLAENVTTYKVDFTLYPLPTALPVGWSYPSGATWTLPSSQIVPEVIIPSTAIQLLFGISGATYPPVPISTIYSFSSTATPQITDTTSVLMTANCINSPFSNPTNVIFSFAIKDAFGEYMSPPINQLVYNTISAGYYSYLEITFLDNLYRALQIRDTNLVIALVIRSKN